MKAKHLNFDEIDYGPVCVTRGRHKGRIGYYDGDELANSIVHFGHPLTLCGYYFVRKSSIRIPATEDLLDRRDRIQLELVRLKLSMHVNHPHENQLLYELQFIEGALIDRITEKNLRSKVRLQGKKIFISHSSKDKPFVRRVVDDLKVRGYHIWFDEKEIRAGDSIPISVQRGLDESAYILVFLSSNALESSWVEAEWAAKFWDEVNERQVKVIPVLIEAIEKKKIPTLLRNKKYVDLVADYNKGLLEILRAFA